MKRFLSTVLAVVLALSCSCVGVFAASSYTVVKGDTMTKIARQNGLTLRQLCDANPEVTNPNFIRVGQVLRIPGTNDASQSAAPAGAGSEAPKKTEIQVKSIGGISEVRASQTPGYSVVPVPDKVKYDNAVVMNYIQEFANITQVPHSSFNTEKITAYLKAWAEAKGVKVETEEIGNVIMFLPATKGYENAPTMIFQGHIDMVEAVDEGVTHDWKNDPLELLWTENSVKANGTSLGADNASGIAFMLTYIDYADKFVHGPLRFIFTVDEEVGLYGAHALDPKYLEGADYMVNADGGYGGAVIACAGGKYFQYTHSADWTSAPAGSVAYQIEFKDLKGGHSAGVGGGKANALVAAANAVLALVDAGLDVNIAEFEGGSASNAIPKNAKVVVTLKSADVAKANEVLDAFAKKFNESYSVVETQYSFNYGKSNASVSKVMSQEVSETLVRLMSAVPNNVHTLLAQGGGTEASSNLGVFTLDEENVSFTCMMRSSSTYQTEQITLISEGLAAMSGFDMEVPTTFASWPLRGNNKLGEIAAEVFKDLTGEDFPLSSMHAGVECGEFSEKAPDLYIISTGVSGGSNGHTTAEAMNFDKVEISVDFLVTLAAKIAQMK